MVTSRAFLLSSGVALSVATLSTGVWLAVTEYPDREAPRALFYLYMALAALDIVSDATDIRTGKSFTIYRRPVCCVDIRLALFAMGCLSRLGAMTQLDQGPATTTFFALSLARFCALMLFVLAVILSGVCFGCTELCKWCFRERVETREGVSV